MLFVFLPVIEVMLLQHRQKAAGNITLLYPHTQILLSCLALFFFILSVPLPVLMHDVIPFRTEECSGVVLASEPVYTHTCTHTKHIEIQGRRFSHMHTKQSCVTISIKEHQCRVENHQRGAITKRCYTSPFLLLLLFLFTQLFPPPPSFIPRHQGRTVLQMKQCSTFAHTLTHMQGEEHLQL